MIIGYVIEHYRQNSCLEDRVISSLFCIQSNFWKEQSGQ